MAAAMPEEEEEVDVGLLRLSGKEDEGVAFVREKAFRSVLLQCCCCCCCLKTTKLRRQASMDCIEDFAPTTIILPNLWYHPNSRNHATYVDFRVGLSQKL